MDRAKGCVEMHGAVLCATIPLQWIVVNDAVVAEETTKWARRRPA